MHPVSLEVWGRKTWQQEEVGWTILAENLGEEVHDLGQPLAVPQGTDPVHRWGDEVGPGRVG